MWRFRIVWVDLRKGLAFFFLLIFLFMSVISPNSPIAWKHVAKSNPEYISLIILSQKAPLTKRYYENRIRCAMGGRIAEELIYGKENISVGAAEDMKTATGFARAMV